LLHMVKKRNSSAKFSKGEVPGSVLMVVCNAMVASAPMPMMPAQIREIEESFWSIGAL